MGISNIKDQKVKLHIKDKKSFMFSASLLFVALAVLSLPLAAAAKDIKFEISVDQPRVAIGDAVQLGLTFYGSQDVPAPDIGNIDGFETRYLGPSTMMTVINGKVSSSVTHMYRLVALRIGKFQVGPFSFNYKGDTYESNMVFVEVSEERPVREEPAREDAVSKLNLEDRIFVTLKTEKASAYVNELIPVIVKLYVKGLNVTDIQLPVFAQEGFSKVEFKEPKQYRETLGGTLYEVLEFRTSIFGTRPGDYKLGPASIKCNVVMSRRFRRPGGREDFLGEEPFEDPFFENFFTRHERYPLELKSEELPISIFPFPQEGRPSDFSGAIGDYQFIFNVNPTKVKAGDPITLKMEINGTGNFNTVLMPALDNTENFKIYEPEVKTEANSKKFTQVLIPENEKITQSPKAVFSYFDPMNREYKTITQGPIALTVEAAKDKSPAQVVGPVISTSRGEAPAIAPVEPEELKRDIVYIKESLGTLRQKGKPFYETKITYFLLPLPLIALAALHIVYARADRFRRDTRYSRKVFADRAAARGLKTLKKNLRARDRKSFYEILFKTLQNYLGPRFNLSPAGLTFGVLDSTLFSMGIEPEIRNKIKMLFEICDESRFAFFEADDSRMRDDFKNLEEVIRYLERARI